MQISETQSNTQVNQMKQMSEEEIKSWIVHYQNEIADLEAELRDRTPLA